MNEDAVFENLLFTVSRRIDCDRYECKIWML